MIRIWEIPATTQLRINMKEFGRKRVVNRINIPAVARRDWGIP
jgi:hypothetical protein